MPQTSAGDRESDNHYTNTKSAEDQFQAKTEHCQNLVWLYLVRFKSNNRLGLNTIIVEEGTQADKSDNPGAKNHLSFYGTVFNEKLPQVFSTRSKFRTRARAAYLLAKKFSEEGTQPSKPPHPKFLKHVVPNYPSFEPAPPTTVDTSSPSAVVHFEDSDNISRSEDQAFSNNQSASGSSNQDFDDSDHSSSSANSFDWSEESAFVKKKPEQTATTESRASTTKDQAPPSLIEGSSRKRKVERTSQHRCAANRNLSPQKRKAEESSSPQHQTPKQKATKMHQEHPYVRVYVDGNEQSSTVIYGIQDVITEIALCKLCTVFLNLPCIADRPGRLLPNTNNTMNLEFFASEYISNPLTQELANLTVNGRPVFSGPQDPTLVYMLSQAISKQNANGDIMTTVSVQFANNQNFRTAEWEVRGQYLVVQCLSEGQPTANRMSQQFGGYGGGRGGNSSRFADLAHAAHQHPADTFGAPGSSRFADLAHAAHQHPADTFGGSQAHSAGYRPSFPQRVGLQSHVPHAGIYGSPARNAVSLGSSLSQQSSGLGAAAPHGINSTNNYYSEYSGDPQPRHLPPTPPRHARTEYDPHTASRHHQSPLPNNDQYLAPGRYQNVRDPPSMEHHHQVLPRQGGGHHLMSQPQAKATQRTGNLRTSMQTGDQRMSQPPKSNDVPLQGHGLHHHRAPTTAHQMTDAKPPPVETVVAGGAYSPRCKPKAPPPVAAARAPPVQVETVTSVYDEDNVSVLIDGMHLNESRPQP